MSEGFLIDPQTGMLFFRFCKRYKIDRLADRVLVMREIVRRKKAKYIRDVDSFIEGKTVIRVTKGGKRVSN